MTFNFHFLLLKSIQFSRIMFHRKWSHSLMCRATKMWSMKMWSFVPFFLNRPRRAACRNVKDEMWNMTQLKDKRWPRKTWCWNVQKILNDNNGIEDICKNTNQSNILIQNLELMNFEMTNTQCWPVLVWGSGDVFLPRVFQERDCSPPSQMSCSTFGRSWSGVDNYRRNLLDNGVGNWFKGCMMVLIRLTHHS